MNFCDRFGEPFQQNLLRNPGVPLSGDVDGNPYKVQISLPHYRQRLEEHYRDILPGGLASFSQQVNIPFAFEHYGVEIELGKAIEVHPHDDAAVMHNNLHKLIDKFGAVIIRNANMVSHLREYGHRNRFPHLNFHVDRSPNQPTVYSMYARDPYDPEQKYPRTSSTLFVPTIVGHLQAVREGQLDPAKDKGPKATYSIFNAEDMSVLLGNIILEHRWDMPVGTGEISILDNRTSLHSSYYRDINNKGYKIGVRYLA